MKKILFSTGIIIFVAAVAYGATGAFFSDSETSTGNTFTAGAIDLKVDSTQHFNNAVCVNNLWALEPSAQATVPQYPVIGTGCDGTWGQTAPLDITNQKFFNFADLKPGDNGENTISLHVDNNNAWACATINVTNDDDVTCTTPESKDDSTCVANLNQPFNGEMAKNLSFAWWADNGDNILQPNELPTLFFRSGAKLSDLLVNHQLHLTLADSLQNFFGHAVGWSLQGSQTYYVGTAWCMGDMAIDPSTATISCSGKLLTNEAQTDQLKADLTFTVVQDRNNSAFRCEDTYKPI
jgi:predicted ribosomally synthesized peptide with SipW-like signal peptide